MLEMQLEIKKRQVALASIGGSAPPPRSGGGGRQAPRPKEGAPSPRGGYARPQGQFATPGERAAMSRPPPPSVYERPAKRGSFPARDRQAAGPASQLVYQRSASAAPVSRIQPFQPSNGHAPAAYHRPASQAQAPPPRSLPRILPGAPQPRQPQRAPRGGRPAPHPQGARSQAVPAVAQKQGDPLGRLITMRRKLEGPGVVSKTLLDQYAGDLQCEILRTPLNPEAAAEVDALFGNFHARLTADVQAGRRGLWDPLAQTVKQFFEVGFHCRRSLPGQSLQQTFFLRYVDALNLFLTPPEASPASPSPEAAALGLRPTLAAAVQGELNAKAANDLVPDSLAPSDLLVELYADIETDIYRRNPATEQVGNLAVHRRRKGTLKLALAIMQSCDFNSFQPGSGSVKTPPVVVLCHSKAMVLKLADTLNWLGRYEYDLGYAGAEAAYGDTGGLSPQPVSILLCTPGRLLGELKGGALDLAAVRLLVFTAQYQLMAPEYIKVRDQAPAPTRVLVFLGGQGRTKEAASAAPLLRNAPMRLYWESPEAAKMSVEPYVPGALPPKRASNQAAAASPAVGPKAQTSDMFGVPLHVAIVPTLRRDNIKQATRLQRRVVPLVMTGQDLVVVTGPTAGTALSFVVPTAHLILAMPTNGPRVLVVAATIDGVDRVVGEYLRFATEEGFAVEGLHSKRLTGYETPFNDRANIIVGTPNKLGNVLQGRDKTLSVTLDLSGVEVLVLYKLNNKADLREADAVLEAITAAHGGRPQVLAFVPKTSEALAQPIVDQFCPGAEIITGTDP